MTDPWPVGTRVRLTAPDCGRQKPRREHPRKGQVGTVEARKGYEAVVAVYNGRAVVKEPACWLLWVRFGGEYACHGLFDREVVREGGT